MKRPSPEFVVTTSILLALALVVGGTVIAVKSLRRVGHQRAATAAAEIRHALDEATPALTAAGFTATSCSQTLGDEERCLRAPGGPEPSASTVDNALHDQHLGGSKSCIARGSTCTWIVPHGSAALLVSVGPDFAELRRKREALKSDPDYSEKARALWTAGPSEVSLSIIRRDSTD